MTWIADLRSALARDTPAWQPARTSLSGLTEVELQRLGAYNAERARGLVHTDEWQAAMAALQARFNAGVGG